MSDHHIQYAVLGMVPYALIEMTDAKDDGDSVDIDLRMSIGGGIDRAAGIELLKIALEQLEENTLE